MPKYYFAILIIFLFKPACCFFEEPEKSSTFAIKKVSQTTIKKNSPSEEKTTTTSIQEPKEHPEYNLREEFFELEGTKMRILIQGDPKATPVLLLHGATFRAELWSELGTMDLLALNGFLALSADLPGHGKTQRPKVSMDKILHSLIKKANINKPVVLAHSFAGRLVFPMLINHPENLLGAVLISPVDVLKNKKKLAANPTKVLIIWGEYDEMIPKRLAGELLKNFPNGKKYIIKGANHECYNHNTDLFHKLLLDFLSTLLN